MKKIQVGLIAFMMIFSLSGCSKEKNENTVVEPENQSINEQEQPSDLPQTQETKINSDKKNTSGKNINSLLKDLDNIDIDEDSSKELDSVEADDDSNDLDSIEE